MGTKVGTEEKDIEREPEEETTTTGGSTSGRRGTGGGYINNPTSLTASFRNPRGEARCTSEALTSHLFFFLSPFPFLQ